MKRYEVKINYSMTIEAESEEEAEAEFREVMDSTLFKLDVEELDNETIEEKAAKILNTWSKEDLIGDILELTSKEGLIEFVEQNK